jgi:gliding motility-associated-like protein
MKKFFSFLYFVALSSTLFAQQAKTGDLQFIQNNGQWQSNITHKADVPGGALFLEKNCFTWHFSNISELTEHTGRDNEQEKKILKGHAFKTFFAGSNNTVQVTGIAAFDNYYNYFIGRDKKLWRGNVPAYAKVLYSNLYEKIDAVIYSQNRNIKYDLIVKPGADITDIALQYTGVDNLILNNGNLEITTSVNKIIELKPYAYQQYGNYTVTVPCHFNLKDNVVTFHFPNGYDTNIDLVIDPATLIFASYSGSTSDNWGYSATYDVEGNLYGAGIVFGTGYPVTTGSYQEDFGGGTGSWPCDVGISKFSPDGTSLVYSTYLGGSENELPHSLIVNDDNELIVYGTTSSEDFPVSASAFSSEHGGGDIITVTYVVQFINGADIFITKLSADGSAIVGSTYIGGSENDGLNQGATAYNYGDHARGEVIFDEAGNIYIASSTLSSDFPVTTGVYDDSYAGAQDGVICKLNSDLSSMLWATYIGGSSADGAYSLKLLSDGSVATCGGTASNSFPATSGVWMDTYNGGTADGWVAVLNSSASILNACSFAGTNQYDQAYFIETDKNDNIYITGQTRGSYPVVSSLYEDTGSSQFITKLSSDLISVIYSTVFGSGTSAVNIAPTAFLVDTCENVYVSGWGGTVNQSFNFETGTTSGMTTSADAEDASTDGSDYYFFVMQKDASGLIYATYFGGSPAEHVDGGTSRFDKEGRIYQAVCAGCGGSDAFPTTDGAYSEDNGSTNCNLGVIKFEFNFIGPAANIAGSPLSGCAPLTVDFTNSSVDATDYAWDFGDGTTSTEATPIHTFTEPGTYTVNFSALDPTACDPSDEAVLTVTVYGYPEAGFTFEPNPANIYSAVNFTDASVDAVSWQWNFGDGSTASVQNPAHQYLAPGEYEVCLTVENANGCENEICYPIEVIAYSILDAPNAFTPNGDGINDTYVAPSYGLTYFEIEIYNRWGEMVFYSNNPAVQWDGYYKGIEQEMDTYVFIMRGTGEDGQNFYKQGNITLVR